MSIFDTIKSWFKKEQPVQPTLNDLIVSEEDRIKAKLKELDDEIERDGADWRKRSISNRKPQTEKSQAYTAKPRDLTDPYPTVTYQNDVMTTFAAAYDEPSSTKAHSRYETEYDYSSHSQSSHSSHSSHSSDSNHSSSYSHSSSDSSSSSSSDSSSSF